MRDTLTILWKESREILHTGGGSRLGRLSVLISPLVFGLFLPAEFGRLWLGSPIVLFFAVMLPFLLVSTVVADSFAGERERHTLETLLSSRLPDQAILFGKLIAAVGFGWGLMLAALLLGIISANLTHRHTTLLLYRADVGLGSVILSFASAWFASSFGVLVSLRSPTVQQAQQIISYSMALPGLLLGLASLALPSATRRAAILGLVHAGLFAGILAISAVFLAFGAVLLIVAIVRFQRTRLSLG